MLDKIIEVSGVEYSEIIHRMNNLSPHLFPPLRDKHLSEGFWWLILHRDKPEAFAGMVPMVPFHTPDHGIGYLKRCWVSSEYRGRGWQKLLLEERERKARDLGWKMLVAECGSENHASSSNFLRCGYVETLPEQIWATNSRYFVKVL